MRTVEQEWQEYKSGIDVPKGVESLLRRVFFAGFLGGVSSVCESKVDLQHLAALHDEICRALGRPFEALSPLVAKIPSDQL